jgi:hypothetical protein
MHSMTNSNGHSSNNANGLEAFQTLRQFLAKGEWNAKEMEGQFAFTARVEAPLCPRNYFFQIKIELEQFLFYIAPTLTLLPDMLPGVAEYIARANYGMRIGNFDLDYKGAKVNFRTSINFKGVPLVEQMIDNAISPALVAYDEFFPGLIEVIAGSETPERAISLIEYGDAEELPAAPE